MINLPEKFLAQMKELLEDEYQDYLASFDYSPINALRINTNKISIEDFLSKNLFDLEQIEWSQNGFIYPNDIKPSKHPYYYAGLYYLQDPSAMYPASLLPIEEGDLVLDACAAPGGKSTEIANKLHNTGLLVANDISVSRSQALLKNIELAGIQNAFVISESTNKLKNHFSKYFDKILIDAPCSGEGMFRKDPSLIKSWQQKDASYYVLIQKEIVKDCLEMLKDGGMMVYSTCTFNKQEDEEIIEYMKSLANIKVISSRKLFPHKVKGEGQFACLIQKEGKKEKTPFFPYTSVPLPNCVTEFLKNVSFSFENGYFDIFSNKVLWIPNIEINTKSLRVLRSGLLLGEIKNDHFEPSQAFACALSISQYSNVLNLSLDDPRVLKYLKGETITNDSLPNGYCLVAVDSFSLGWAKVDNHQVKNKYEKGWRYQ